MVRRNVKIAAVFCMFVGSAVAWAAEPFSGRAPTQSGYGLDVQASPAVQKTLIGASAETTSNIPAQFLKLDDRQDMGLPHVSPEDIAKAVEAEGRSRPEILFGLAMAAFTERRKHESQLSAAVLDYFGVYLARMKHGVWIGDVKSDRTAFAFVDYSSPVAGVFIKGLESFAAKGKVRIAMLPSSGDEKSSAAALLAASASSKSEPGVFGSFIAALEKKAEGYNGDPMPMMPEKHRLAVLGGVSDAEVIEQVAAVRLVAMALELPQPLALVMNSRRYVGDLSDGEEMSAFFAPPPATALPPN